MKIISIDKKMHMIVLRLNGDSCKKIQVNNGNVKYEIPNASNLTDHALPVTSYDIFVAQNANSDIGIPRTIDTINAFFISKPSISCKLELNHTRQCIIPKIQKIKKYCIIPF